MARRARQSRTNPPDARLLTAVRGHDFAGVERALADGADPNSMVDEYWSVLAWSAKMGGLESDLPIARLLVRRGANPDGPCVIMFCRVELLRELLTAGGHVDGPARNGEPLFYAIAGRSKQDKALALINAGARIDVVASNGETPMIAAARSARAMVVRRLVELGADTTCVDRGGRSALRHAIEGLASSIVSLKSAYRAIIKMLRERAPAQPEDLAITAIAIEDLQALAGLLDRGMNVDVRIPGTIGGIGLSMETLLKGSGGLFGILAGMPSQASLDPLAGGTTLLMWAVALERPAVVSFLLAHGADANLRTADGISACDISIQKGNAAVQRLLGTAGVSWFQYKPGKAFAPPAPANGMPDDSGEVSVRARRLVPFPVRPLRVDVEARSQKQHDTYAEHETRELEEALDIDLGRLDEVATPRISYDGPSPDLAIEWTWEWLSIEHVREDASRLREAAEKAVAVGMARYASADVGVPEICPEFWMKPFSCVLAAASLLRDKSSLMRLAKWVTPDRPRGPRSPMYNERYFRWPLYQIWCAALAQRSIYPTWRTMVERETAKLPKLLLNATDAIVKRDAKMCITALKGSVALHKRFAIVRGEVIAERVLLSDICFVASEARRAGVFPLLEDELSDWVLAEP